MTRIFLGRISESAAASIGRGSRDANPVGHACSQTLCNRNIFRDSPHLKLFSDLETLKLYMTRRRHVENGGANS
jgi:hypothetical protein